MMRVLTPNGNVIEVEKAEAIVEKRVSFNGRLLIQTLYSFFD